MKLILQHEPAVNAKPEFRFRGMVLYDTEVDVTAVLTLSSTQSGSLFAPRALMKAVVRLVEVV